MRTTNEEFDELILSKGYSFDEVAKKMGITRQRLFQLRQRPERMGLLHMEMLSEIIGVPFAEIHEIHKKARGE